MKRSIKWLIIISASCLCALTISAALVINEIKQITDKLYHPLDQRETVQQQTVPLLKQQQKPFSLALLGVDERGKDKGRADTIIICTVNPEKQTAKLLSIPRDTYVPIIDSQMSDKINHTYAYGGTELTVQTIEQLLEIPIHYVVKVNMEGFTDIIEAIGDIQVENRFAFDYEGENFAQGAISLDGERALKYVRMRFEDPQGDFGRQDRQKDVLKAMLAQVTKFQTVRHYPQIIDVIEENVEMNLSFDTLLALRKDFIESFEHIEQFYFTQGIGKKLDGIYYYFLDVTELQNIQITLQSHLNLATNNPQLQSQQIAVILNF